MVVLEFASMLLLVLFYLGTFITGVTFLYPDLLLLGLFLPILSVVSIIHWQQKQNLATRYSGIGRTKMISVKFGLKEAFFPYFLIRCALLFILLAMAQPVAGSKKIKGNKKVLDLVICLDISNSMNTVDMSGNQASRLTAAKHAINELLNKLTGERISVVIFANDAYVQLPLTLDYGAAKLFIPDIESSMISDQGTNIGSALEIAQTQFKDAEAGQAILVITDGEDHADLWKKQIADLATKNITLSYLGLGSEKGGLIPEDPNNPKLGYKRENGKAIVSRIDKSALTSMAAASGSKLAFSDIQFPSVIEIVNGFKASKNKKVELDFVVARNYFYIPASFALLSLLAYYFVQLFIQKRKK